MLTRKPLGALKYTTYLRNRIFKERGRACEKCGWAEENPFYGIVPVQINHIDGNRDNNNEDNVEVLCPNCHSLSEHYMFFGRSHKESYGKKGTKRLRVTRTSEDS